MFGVSLLELLTVMGLILILFGPDKLPQMARQLGRFMGELRRNTDSLRREFYNSVYNPAQDLNRKIDSNLRTIGTLDAEPSTQAETSALSSDAQQAKNKDPGPQ